VGAIGLEVLAEIVFAHLTNSTYFGQLLPSSAGGHREPGYSAREAAI
jgi:hypothetical protein